MKIVVIADDLTGAAEVAGAALRFGLTAEVQVGRIYASEADVIVVDADSRSSDTETATAKMLELTMQSLALRPDAMFKKVDSLLRGPVAAEIDAMRAAGGFQRCLLVCGNPRKQRTVVGGKIFVDGVPLHQTRFADDPEHPRPTNIVTELLSDCAATDIGDAICPADLQAHARHWHSRRWTTLAAGGAEFFEAAVAACMAGDDHAGKVLNLTASDDPTPMPDGDVLLISGSSMTQCDDWPIVPLQESKTSFELAAEVCNTLSYHGRAAIRAADAVGGSPAERVTRLAEVASRILASCRPSQVWIEGGRTASTLIRELGYQRLVAVANVGDGIVALRSVDENSPLYLIKPGSYPWIAGEGNDFQTRRTVPGYAMAKKWLPLAAFFCFSQSLVAQSPDVISIVDVLHEQCVDCHNAESQEGAVNLSRFRSLDDIDQDRSLWKTIFDVVEARQMPLPQSGYELDESQRQELLNFTRDALSRPDPTLKAIDPGKPILRRLTRLEYNNTVRDLFGLNYDIFMFPERLPVADKSYFTHGGNFQSPKFPNPNVAGTNTENESRRHGLVVQTSMHEYGTKYDVLLPQLGLPGDNRAEHGFANRGDALNFSPLLFEKYLQLASAIAGSERLLNDSPVMQELLNTEPSKPIPTAMTEDAVELSGEFAARERIGKEADQNDTWHHSFVGELTTAFEHGSGGTFDVPMTVNNQTIPGKGGVLKLRGKNGFLSINPNVDLWLTAFASADETSGDHLLTNRNKNEKVFELTFDGGDVADPPIQQFGVCVLARRNQSGRVRLAVMLSNGKRMTREADVNDSSGNVFFSWVAPSGTSIKKLAIDGSEFSGDYVLLDDLGFIFGEQEHSKDLAKTSKPAAIKSLGQEQRSTKERVARFLSRAYRRSVTETELKSALDFVADRVTAGETETAALRCLVQAVLSSPEFLFLAEPVANTKTPVRALQADELANRLSYFLWSSMPDDELLAVASCGEICDAVILRAQIGRMLAERSRSRELSESFAVQWLRLDQLYSSKPDRELFMSFYSGPQGKSTLHGPMMTEALLLFETVLVEDLSVLQLYDSNFTWLNEQIAKLYRLEGEFETARSLAVGEGLIPETLPNKTANSYWLRTSLPDRTRGGVLTMGGTLTLTSLPFRTSPIKRGAWLLETVFNRPPNEPKVAFVLEEAVNADDESLPSQTVRQLFEKHRSDPNCNSCHSRIDPPGFSLEVFDAMGRLRTHDGEQPVDASGTWNDHNFSTPAEFKDAIRANEHELVRGFVEHLLSYALGRELQHFDMQSVDKIVADSASDGYRISAIIEGIVHSYPFQHVRNQP